MGESQPSGPWAMLLYPISFLVLEWGSWNEEGALPGPLPRPVPCGSACGLQRATDPQPEQRTVGNRLASGTGSALHYGRHSLGMSECEASPLLKHKSEYPSPFALPRDDILRDQDNRSNTASGRIGMQSKGERGQDTCRPQTAHFRVRKAANCPSWCYDFGGAQGSKDAGSDRCHGHGGCVNLGIALAGDLALVCPLALTLVLALVALAHAPAALPFAGLGLLW